ncbi:hypothetical protein ACPOL_4037 [Acidisarcina polymorpha]|uniref:Mycothiol-dependent maleylpyruvate isomerase metal-binding domain-containing protein n=1 Tax=Acidisarcina polymorpha TaxID=2211140 RepID=A0A2Z5G479_9BACT|nr:hypothetical protein ACPOL_4037 [Acidisarcina polymorpha]
MCAPLIRKVDERLIDLLKGLSPEEWELQTISPAWKVRDVAAHLLDTALRKLSIARDCYMPQSVELKTPRDLVDLVNRLNHEGVQILRRLSSPVLIDLMAITCGQLAAFHEALDPFASAAFGVSWAGETTSLNWFDTARELTERWHHQQQIREATNRPGIMVRELYHPVLDCFLRGLPHCFSMIATELGTTVEVKITGDSGGTWLLRKNSTAWSLMPGLPSEPSARAIIPETLAWKLFTKGIKQDDAYTSIQLEGDLALARQVCELTSIVA